jgi:formiminotetrahydrofolate cyclodeaminase
MKVNQKCISDLGAAAYLLMHDFKVIGRNLINLLLIICQVNSIDLMLAS